MCEENGMLKRDKMIDAVVICKKVLIRLSIMDYEKNVGNSSEQLIFPNKIQAKGNIKRISEQELRLLFIEEFKEAYPKLFYSIETPTVKKYKFGNSYDTLEINNKGQSASLDMCVFEWSKKHYQRMLNIEFKHKNVSIKNIAKDILKLIGEEQNGAYIHLLTNTDNGTLCNNNRTGVFNKLYRSFSDFKEFWNGYNKNIRIIIISLDQKILIHHEINKSNLKSLKEIFFMDSSCDDIKKIKGNDWKSWAANNEKWK